VDRGRADVQKGTEMAIRDARHQRCAILNGLVSTTIPQDSGALHTMVGRRRHRLESLARGLAPDEAVCLFIDGTRVSAPIGSQIGHDWHDHTVVCAARMSCTQACDRRDIIACSEVSERA
jgi:hypothetical protein